MKQMLQEPLSEVKLSYINTHLSGTQILDVGAGACHYSRWVAQRHPASQVVALDRLDLSAELCSGISYHKINLEQPLPFADATFDTILAFDIIEHIERADVLLGELSRVSKPGAVMIGSVPHDNDGFLPAYNLTFYHRSDLTHRRYYVPDSLKQTLEFYGFKMLNIDKKGGVSPQVIAEFFPKGMQFLVKKCIGVLRRTGVVDATKLSSDLFFVARKR